MTLTEVPLSERGVRIETSDALVVATIEVATTKGPLVPLVARWFIEGGAISISIHNVPIATATWTRTEISRVAAPGGGKTLPLGSVGVSEVAFTSAMQTIKLAFLREERAIVGGPHAPIDQAIGAQAERVALELVQQALAPLPWVASIRKGTRRDDHNGIDIVVATADAGDVFVQVKSSKTGAREHRRRHDGHAALKRTAIVVMLPETSRVQLATRLREDLHARYVAVGGKLPAIAPPVLAPPSARAIAPAATGPKVSPPGQGKGARRRARQAALAAGDMSSLTNDHASSTPGYLEHMARLQTIALERERLKTERVRLFQEDEARRLAIRHVFAEIRARDPNDPIIAAVAARWPVLQSDPFLFPKTESETP